MQTCIAQDCNKTKKCEALTSHQSELQTSVFLLDCLSTFFPCFLPNLLQTPLAMGVVCPGTNFVSEAKSDSDHLLLELAGQSPESPKHKFML